MTAIRIPDRIPAWGVRAKAAYKRALEINEAAYGPEHPNVVIDINNMGDMLHDMGDLEGAKAAYERTLAILKQFLAEDHPRLRIVEDNLEEVTKELS